LTLILYFHKKISNMLLLKNITQRKNEEPQSSTEKEYFLKLFGTPDFPGASLCDFLHN
jgi:hypothetical protein